MITSEQAGGDVVEACADALLAAAAMSLVIQTDSGEPINIGDARRLAIRAIDRIIDRTVMEGPKPR